MGDRADRGYNILLLPYNFCTLWIRWYRTCFEIFLFCVYARILDFPMYLYRYCKKITSTWSASVNLQSWCCTAHSSNNTMNFLDFLFLKPNLKLTNNKYGIYRQIMKTKTQKSKFMSRSVTDFAITDRTE